MFSPMGSTKSKEAAGLPLLGLTSPLNSISGHGWGRDEGRPRFHNAISDWSGTPLMLSERNMMTVMDRLTDKPEWSRKVFDEITVSKWKKEAIDMFKDEPLGKQFSVAMWDYVSSLTSFVKSSLSSSASRNYGTMRRRRRSTASSQRCKPMQQSSSPTASFPFSLKIAFEPRLLPWKMFLRAPRTGTPYQMRRF